MRVVVTGANRGIGLELVKQLLARGDFVEAGVRGTPEEPVSLETPNGKDDAAPNRSLAEQARKVLATLTRREEEVLRARFGIGDHTLEDVGEDFEVTRERIRQIEARALQKLRHSSGDKRLQESTAEPSRFRSEDSGLRLHRCDVGSDEEVAAFAPRAYSAMSACTSVRSTTPACWPGTPMI